MGLAIFIHILPAASSLALAAPCGFAVKKYLLAEAFMYGFAMIFQLLHHLCECPGISVIFCLLGDDLLRYFSTYATVLSMFMSIVNLTSFTRTRRLTFYVTMGMMFSVRIYQTSSGYGVYSGPLIISLLLLTFSWGRKMYQTKKLHPEKSLWLKNILPAFLFGSVSMVMILYVEDSLNYGFVHSLHHLSLAVAIYLCLQITEDGEKPNSNEKSCSCCRISALACCC